KREARVPRFRRLPWAPAFAEVTGKTLILRPPFWDRLRGSNRSRKTHRRPASAPGEGAGPAPVDKKVRIKLDPAIRLGVEFHHPSPDTVRIELPVDRPVERTCEV